MPGAAGARGARPKELHMAECVDDLDRMLDVSNVKGKKLKVVLNGAARLFDEAESERRQGDEERAYVLYMRYLALVEHVRAAPDYRAEKKFIQDMIGSKSPVQAIEWAERLKTSLIERYKRKRPVSDPPPDPHPPPPPSPPPIDAPAKATPDEDDLYADDRRISLTSSRLFALLRDASKRVLVLDTRPRRDFAESRIKFAQCVSAPEDQIQAGFTASKLEKILPQDSVLLWSQRSSMDFIVLLDWSSVDIIPGKTLHLLKTILLKWDPQVVYKHEPIILKGGYENWLLTYPTYTTNPHVVPPTASSNFEDLLNGIDYPEAIVFSDASSTTVDRTSKPNIPNKNPSVDRSSKAAAVQTYEERSREMEKLMEERERLAGTSLNIEKKRVLAEKSWEELRQNSKVENEEEANLLREQELLSEIMQLESVQRDMTLENQQLREQLEAYKRREHEERTKIPPSPAPKDDKMSKPTDSEPMEVDEDTNTAKKAKLEAEALAKEQKIKTIEDEKAALARQREIMQSDREKILAEAREKKKLLYRDSDEDNFTAPAKMPTPEIPRFDRTTKPSPNTQQIIEYYQNANRDFQGVCGNQGQGLTGLKNLGNTCYMNSIMQCLNNTSYLNKYFRENMYREHIRHRSQTDRDNSEGTQGAVAEEVAAVVKALWSGQYRFISPKDFRNVIGRYRSIFRGVEQQDSHEFLTFLMDWLHNDLQITVGRQIHSDPLSAPEKAWLDYTKSKESIILKLFYGQIKSTVKCSRCGKESVTHDTFSNLSLELPENANRCSLSDCLDLYLHDEKIIGWDCPSCKEKRDAIKKLDFSKLPPVLVIHFKRFYVDPKDYMSNSYKKKQTYINFPLKNFVLYSHEDNRKKQSATTMYNLYAVSNHYGSMESGHCTAFCKSSQYSKWFKFDDHSVTDISQNDVVSSAAYILFYTSLPDTCLSPAKFD